MELSMKKFVLLAITILGLNTQTTMHPMHAGRTTWRQALGKICTGANVLITFGPFLNSGIKRLSTDQDAVAKFPDASPAGQQFAQEQLKRINLEKPIKLKVAPSFGKFKVVPVKDTLILFDIARPIITRTEIVAQTQFSDELDRSMRIKEAEQILENAKNFRDQLKKSLEKQNSKDDELQIKAYK